MGATLSREELDELEAKRRKCIEDLYQSTNLNNVDGRVLQSIFKEVGKGQPLSLEQFNVALKMLESHGLNVISNTPLAIRMFEQFDVDGSGGIDEQELLTGFTVLAKGSIDEKVDLTFRLYDLDGNGYIDKQEMTTMMKRSLDSGFQMASLGKSTSIADVAKSFSDQLGGSDSESDNEDVASMFGGMFDMVVDTAVDAAFTAFDANEDGKLTIDEFKVWAMQSFAEKEGQVKAKVNGLEVGVPLTLFAGPSTTKVKIAKLRKPKVNAEREEKPVNHFRKCVRGMPHKRRRQMYLLLNETVRQWREEDMKKK